MYIKRQIENIFLKASSFFKAVLVTGPRQVGKTTMLKELSAKQGREYVSLDDMTQRSMAKSDPALFFQIHKPPLLIDEVQKAPELFDYIKILCDENQKNGEIWMTGSQSYPMMKAISESLAGRVGILRLYGFSFNEINGMPYRDPISFESEALLKRRKKAKKTDAAFIFNHIFNGSLPMLQNADELQRKMYFESYVDTYLMRDVMEDGGISDTVRFRKFLTVCASLNGQLLNYAAISEACGISQPTAKSWVEILVGMHIIILIKPYFNNKLKSVIKTPKMYFIDTGLAGYLAGWQDADTLMLGPAAGAFFENYCIMEMIKGQLFCGKDTEQFYYRDKNTKEIDYLYIDKNTIYPIEIKKTAAPVKSMAKNFVALKVEEPLRIGNGIILCCANDLVALDENLYAVPVNYV